MLMKDHPNVTMQKSKHITERKLLIKNGRHILENYYGSDTIYTYT